VLYELTTDKATLEVESFAGGIVKRILVGDGQTVPVNALIAVIGEEEDELPPDILMLAEKAPAAEAAALSPVRAPTTGVPEAPRASPTPTGEVFASPRARKIAAERKVPLAVLHGSGPGGRIVERDVLEYLADLEGVRCTSAAVAYAYEAGVNILDVAAGLQGRRVHKGDVEEAARAGLGRPAAAGAVATVSAGERVPLSAMRRTIARRMTASKQTAPHFYLIGEVRMRAVLDFLGQSAAASAKVTVTGLLTRAAALALKQHPRMNACFNGDALVLRRECNVGVAVDVDGGLFVPVIKHADTKTLSQISAELRSLADAARAGKLIPEQYEGGSITISNLGMYGVDYFVPIINPPESCIVGVGRISDRVVARDGGILVEPMMKVSLSADHRVVDGVEAARFFQTLKGLLEELQELAS
jgi:pyruvate dehydrogenase E2 component (dihydrolipoamide acetyltransferase)